MRYVGLQRFSFILIGLPLLIAACGGTQETGEAHVVVSTQALTSSDVAQVTVTVSGADITPDIIHDFRKTNGKWFGIIGHIPVGTDRTVHGDAYDATGTKIYSGEVTGVTITKGAPVTIILLLQQEIAPSPFVNSIPVLDGLTVSSTKVGPGEPVSLALAAHDPNPDDTLSYVWTATGGSFDDEATAVPTWTAPAVAGSYTLTVSVTDGNGGTNGMTVAVDVQPGYARGNAAVTIDFNTWPTINALTATPGQMAPSSTTTLDLSASDNDGHALSFSWSDGGGDCAGSFSDTTAEDPTWTAPAVAPPSGSCTLTVAVSDGFGGTTTGAIAVQVGLPVTPNVAPSIESTYQSAERVSAGDLVTFRVVASDLESTDLSFDWSATAGTLAPSTDTAASSEVEWVASATCPTTLTVTITDGGAVSTTADFQVGCPFTTGATKTVTGANLQLSDVHRSPSGSLFVVSNGGSYVGEIWVTRSTDNGDTWTTTNLGNAYNNHTYIGRIFSINETTIGVTGTQGTFSPYDSYLHISTDDGVSFNPSWINLSNSGDQYGNKSRGTVLQTPDGNYLGMWSWTGVYSRSSSSLTSWSGTTRRDLGLEQGCPSLATDGVNVFAALTTSTGLSFQTSTDNGETFSQTGSYTTSEPWANISLYRDPASGTFYACGGTATSGDGTVYYVQSTDGGQTWSNETPYVTGLNAGDLWVSCHIDASGITVGYLDASTGLVTVILPG